MWTKETVLAWCSREVSAGQQELTQPWQLPQEAQLPPQAALVYAPEAAALQELTASQRLPVENCHSTGEEELADEQAR